MYIYCILINIYNVSKSHAKCISDNGDTPSSKSFFIITKQMDTETKQD